MHGPRASSRTWRGKALQHSDNVRYFEDCWNAEAEHMESFPDRSLAAVWNRRSDTFVRNTGAGLRQKRSSDVLNLLKETGFSPDGATVLDIGCGPGTHTLPLARAGASVTALDISAAMLGRIRETAETEGLDIATHECSWWSADIDSLGFRNRFDLVIASMTPGVRDLATFDRMMACSKEYCYYSNFVRKAGDRLLYNIYVKILNEEPRTNAHGPGLLYPFMYLYMQGYRPLVRVSRPEGDGPRDWEEEAAKTIDFLGSTRQFSGETRDRIREYYKDAYANGSPGTGSDTFIGMMVWKVTGR